MVLNYSVNKKRINLFIYQILVFILLSISYVFIIQPEFCYMGFELNVDLSRLVIGSLTIFIFSFIGIFVKDKIIYSIWNIILIYNLFGSIIYYQYNRISNEIIISLLIFLIILFCFSFISFKNKNSKFLIEKDKNQIKKVSILALIGLIPFIIFYGKYIDIKNLFLIDVYKTRALFREVGVSGIGYLIAPITRIICPILIAYSIKYNKRRYIIINLFIILYIYLCGAVKSILIGAVAVFVFYRGGYEEKPLIFVKIVLFLTLGGILIYFLNSNLFLLDGFVRRVFFIPPKLDAEYYRFFNNNNNTFWMHTAIGELLNKRSEILLGYDSLSMYVGEILMKKQGFNANVGVLTEGYVSMGYLGILIHSIIISWIYRLISIMNINPILYGIIFVYIYYLNTAFISPLLLTHGLLFLFLFSQLFLKRERL